MTEPISTRIVMVVAENKGVDPTELPPLRDAIDPDALDALFDSEADDTRRSQPEYELRFSYAGRDVHIHDGDITVDE